MVDLRGDLKEQKSTLICLAKRELNGGLLFSGAMHLLDLYKLSELMALLDPEESESVKYAVINIERRFNSTAGRPRVQTLTPT